MSLAKSGAEIDACQGASRYDGVFSGCAMVNGVWSQIAKVDAAKQ